MIFIVHRSDTVCRALEAIKSYLRKHKDRNLKNALLNVTVTHIVNQYVQGLLKQSLGFKYNWNC